MFSNVVDVRLTTADGLGDAADTADPDRDRIPNLVEYAVDRDPNHGTGVNGMDGIMRVLIASADQVRGVLNLPIEPRTEVTLSLEGMGAASGWHEVVSRTCQFGCTGPSPPIDTALDPPEEGRAGFGFVLPDDAAFAGGAVVLLRATSP